MINGAVKRTMEQNLQLKLEGNTSASLYFNGTVFQTAFVGSGNVKAFVPIYIRELPKHLFSDLQVLLIITVIKCLETWSSLIYN